MDNLSIITSIVTITIAIFGWIFALWLQGRNIKSQHKVDILYDIYKQFSQLYIKVQNSLSKLSSVYSPFILMDSCMISYKLNLSTEQEAVLKGKQEWKKFYDETYDSYFEFVNEYLLLQYLFENWQAVFKSLLPAKNILIIEINVLKEKMYSDLISLRTNGIDNCHDWRKWDKNKIEKTLENIRENSSTISMYLSDFMVILHNKLLSKYFKQRRPTRKTLDSKYKVLTKKGITENLDYKTISKMVVYKKKYNEKVQDKLKKIKKEDKKSYKDFLTLLSKNICPECKNQIEIIHYIESDGGFLFQYTCGHFWKEGVIQNEPNNAIKKWLLKLKRNAKAVFFRRKRTAM